MPSDGLADAIIEQTGNAIFVTQAVRTADGQIIDFRYVRANRMACTITGRTAGELAEQTLLSLFPNLTHSLFPDTNNPVANETIFARYVRQMREGGSLTCETTHDTDGIAGTFVVTSTPLFDGLVFTLTDVTEQRRADVRIRQQEQVLRQLLASSENGTIVLKAIRTPGLSGQPGSISDFLSIFWNDAALRISGFTNEQVRTQPLSAFRANFHSVLLPLFSRVMETGQPSQTEYRYNDSGRWMKMSLSRLDTDHLLLLTADIHDLKQAQLANEAQARLLNSVLNAAPNSIFVCEAVRNEDHQLTDLRYVMANQAALDSMQVTAEQLLGSTSSTHVPEHDLVPLLAQYERVIQTGEPFHREEAYRGSYYDVTTLRWQNDGLIISAVDQTEQVRHRRELEQANLNLKRSNEYLQQFAYVASHDLQEPLRKIISFGDMLRQKYAPALTEQGVDLLTRMQRAAGRMSELVHDLLAYSRLTTQQAVFAPVDLNELIQDVLGDFDLTTRNAQLTVSQLPTITGDAGQLRQLFQNLISNALKYVDPGNSPIIRISSQLVNPNQLPSPWPPTADTDARLFYQISVQDNGIGFDEQYLERIFQMFQRLHGRSQFEGSGMGLAICKRVVDNHRGTLTAHSRVGQGSTFLVYLPAST